MEALFLLLVGALAALCGATLGRHAPTKLKRGSFLLLGGWLLYNFVVGLSGVAADTTRRIPGLFLLAGPALAFTLLFTVRSPKALALARALPLPLLLSFHTVRLPVELFLYALWKAGRVPRMVTFEGANFDIVMGISAPLIAALVARGRAPRPLLYGWNVLGLLLLANVVVRGVLTAPGPLQRLFDDFPNRALLQFPYTLLPGFIVPLVLTLHILALRALGKQSEATR